LATINVRVLDKETQQESTLTYKAYRDTAYRFTLIGQVDDRGNLLESDPNLLPQHQRKAVKSPVVADNGANQFREPYLKSTDFIPTLNPPDNTDTFHVEQNHIPGAQVIVDMEAANTGPSSSEPIKERRKPGPKPKNKEQ
jgi:hypothetical protein